MRLTHRVGGHGQTLLDQPFEGGLQDQVLVGDGLLRDLLRGDRLQRLKNTELSDLMCEVLTCALVMLRLMLF